MTKWPAPIVRLYLGETSLDAVLSAANNTDPEKKRQQSCEARYFAGELDRIRGRKDEAIRLLREASRDCHSNPNIFWADADAEIKELEAKP